MMLLDASLALSLVLDDEDLGDDGRILDELTTVGAFVPSLWWQEVANC